jgi:ATP-dependent protease ClpP protease subunit
MASERRRKKHAEIAVVGEVDEWVKDVVEALLEVPPGGACTLYIDSMGGSVYGALAVTVLLRQRRIDATALVLGECSSASLLLFAACQRRLVSRYSTHLFHRMRWQSEKRCDSVEAAQWAKHFDLVEKSTDELMLRLFGKQEKLLKHWIAEGRFVTGQEIADAGLAELVEI